MRNILGYIVWSASQWEKETWLVIFCFVVGVSSLIVQQPLIFFACMALVPIIGLGYMIKEKVTKSYIKYKRIKEASEDCPL
jgi:hypothetical protein